MTTTSVFEPRLLHGSIFFNNHIYVIGGVGSKVYGDVWKNTNAGNLESWESVSDPNGQNVTAAFGPRWGHDTVVHGSKIYVVGGTTASNLQNTSTWSILTDVWHSTDGVTWNL